jgi:hypothetical protein
VSQGARRTLSRKPQVGGPDRYHRTGLGQPGAIRTAAGLGIALRTALTSLVDLPQPSAESAQALLMVHLGRR